MLPRLLSAAVSLGTALLACGLVAFVPAGREQRPDLLSRFGAAAPHLDNGLRIAAQVLPTIAAVALPANTSPEATERQSLGSALADYANNPGADPEQHDGFIGAAKRIVAGGTTAKRTPEATSHALDQAADSILAEVRAAEATVDAKPDRNLEAATTELRIRAQLARFHARRFIAAVRYNLFKRNLSLGELYAATLEEQKAVAAWRELIAVGGNHPLAAHWRRELRNLEFTLKELEDQCCPPDEAILREKIWQPAYPRPEILR